MEVFHGQQLDDLWHKLRKENTAVSDIVPALHHHREALSSFPPWPPPSLTLETRHTPLPFHSCPLVSRAAAATAGNSRGLCPGRGREDGLYWWTRCLLHGFNLGESLPVRLRVQTQSQAHPCPSFPVQFCPELTQNGALSSAPPTWEDREKLPWVPPQRCPFPGTREPYPSACCSLFVWNKMQW